MSEPESLDAWQIREFPRSLRLEIVEEAKRRQMSPGQFATRIFTAARAAGWGDKPSANGLTADPAAAWLRWAEAHRAAREAGMSREMLAALRRQAARELGVPLRPPPPRRLAPPEPAA